MIRTAELVEVVKAPVSLVGGSIREGKELKRTDL